MMRNVSGVSDEKWAGNISRQMTHQWPLASRDFFLGLPVILNNILVMIRDRCIMI